MDVLYERCAGIDVGKADVKVCVRTAGLRGRGRHSEVRTFTTMTRDLLALRDWLICQQVTVVGMEATGEAWKPVFYMLEDAFEVWLLNARHMRNVPGRKTDVADSTWIAQLVEHGLVRPSFVPPEPIRRLRDLTRYRSDLVHERVREVNRLHALLEDAGIKLAVVATDILGVSGRAMLEAMIRGERDPRVLADLAHTHLRRKRDALTEALTGRFVGHHARLARTMLDHIDALDATCVEISGWIDAALAPFRRQLDLLTTIPGVQQRTAQVLLAEIGTDPSRFPTAGHLASWAGMCPGNNESAGKHKTGRTRHGNAYLRAALGEAAHAAARTKNTFLAERCRRLAVRRGKKRAIVATAHAILVSVWFMLTTDSPYQELGDSYHLQHSDKTRRTRHLLTELGRLGYTVTLNPAEATAPTA